MAESLEQCPNCRKRFKDLSKHKVCHGKATETKAELKEDKSECRNCGKWFKDLSNHKVCHGKSTETKAEPKDDKSECRNCGKWFKDLSNHKVCHGKATETKAEPKKDKSECRNCGKWFKDLSNHKVCHGKSTETKAEPKEDKSECRNCGKWFKDLSNHKVCHGKATETKAEPKEDKSECRNCGKWFKDLSNHKVCHGKSAETKAEPKEDKSECRNCGKWFKDLSNHKVCHGKATETKAEPKEDKSECRNCGKWFKDLSNHKVCHGKSTETKAEPKGDKSECRNCGKWFKDLSNHKVCHGKSTETKAEPKEDKSECRNCGEWFKDLSNHKVCHGKSTETKAEPKEDELECRNCGKWFKDLSNHKVCDGRKQEGLCKESQYSLHDLEKATCKEETRLAKSSTPFQSVLLPSQPNPISLTGSQNGKDFGLDKRTLETLETFVSEMLRNGIITYTRNTPRSEVSYFFKHEVQLRQNEIETATKHFTRLQEDVVGFLKSNTPWKWVAFRAGSHYDGTKVSRPNEMDCVLYPVLSAVPQPEYDGCVDGFCRLRVGPDHSITQICDGPYLNKQKYRKYIFDEIEKFVKTTSKGEIKCTKNLKYPDSPSFGLKYEGVCTDLGKLEIDVDFVPVIHVRSWPPSHIARDLRRLQNLNPKIKPEELMEDGVNLVTTSCPAEGSPDDGHLQWKISCSDAEKTLTKYGEKTCWKPVLRTMKRVLEIAKESKSSDLTNKSLDIQRAATYALDNYIRDRNFKVRFTTYHIRSLMWNLLYESTAGSHVWKDDTHVSKLHFSLEKLRHMISGKIRVPNFFIPVIRNIMATTRPKDRELMYILVRATEIMFKKSDGTH